MPVLIPNNEPRQIPLTFTAADGSAAAAPSKLDFTAASGRVVPVYADGMLTLTPTGDLGADTVQVKGLAGSLDVAVTAPAANVVFGV